MAKGYRDRHLPADVMVVDWCYYTKMGQMDMAGQSQMQPPRPPRRQERQEKARAPEDVRDRPGNKGRLVVRTSVRPAWSNRYEVS